MFLGDFYSSEQQEAIKELFAPVVSQLVSQIAEKVVELRELREPKFISRQEAAEMLGVSLPSLHNYTKQGLIEKHVINGRVLYDAYEIQKAVEMNLKYRRT